ncbi:hypothetical protein ACN6MY_05095 [Peribacillus sp. B-H-3]|uniref:hypothetical protein n=1 Tax=Peribacillus sp. B-H-3 TaxID=3400420 RepID=UPI003B02D817
MRVLLELLRIIIIFLFGGGLLYALLNAFYSVLGADRQYDVWFLGAAIFIFLFVLYRNKLQFTGWASGYSARKLSKKHLLFRMSCVSCYA